jgi:hypothetical protein
MFQVMKTIFLGPSSVQRATPAGGRRSKSSSNKMTEVTVPTIAYCAMLVCYSYLLACVRLTVHPSQLRFTLHQAPTWYAIDNEIDTRFDYFVFYLETIDFLEEATLAEYTKSLILELNKYVFEYSLPQLPNKPIYSRIFPRGSRPRASVVSTGQSSRLRVLEAMRHHYG